MPIHERLIDTFFPEKEARDLAARTLWVLQKMNGHEFDGIIKDLTPLMEDEIRRAGWVGFRSRWAYVRQLLPLQGRLLIEQVLWAMGPPWRTLLTGFNPVELGAVGVLEPLAWEDVISTVTNVDDDQPSGGGGGWLPGGGSWIPGDEPKAVVYGRKKKWKAYWTR